MLYKEKRDLLYRKDTESVHLQRTIDWKNEMKWNFNIEPSNSQWELHEVFPQSVVQSPIQSGGIKRVVDTITHNRNSQDI